MTISFNLQNYLDNLTFLALFIAMLSYWTSISFTSLKIGTRVDKEQTMEDKVNVVEQKLNQDGKKK